MIKINKMEKNRNKEFFFNKLYHLLFSEKFSKKINYNFDKKNRLDLIDFVIKKINIKTSALLIYYAK